MNREHKFNEYFIYVNLDELSNRFIENSIRCSVISSAVLAEFVPIEQKRLFIEILLSNEFRITHGDRLMASIDIYDQISTNIKFNIVLFLLSDMLRDVKLQVIGLIIEPYNPLR